MGKLLYSFNIKTGQSILGENTMTTKKAATKKSTTKKSVKKAAPSVSKRVKQESKPKMDKKVSKADEARKIMKEMWKDLQSGKVARKDVIQRFQSDAGLTKSGSSTYFFNLKREMLKAGD